MWTQVTYLLIAAGIIALNAFFVAAEFALVKVRATRLRELADAGNRRATRSLAMLEKLDAHLSTCQLGVTVASLALGWVGEPAVSALLEPVLRRLGFANSAVLHTISVALGFAVLTAIHIVIGEQAPKMFAIRKPESSTMFVARTLQVFHFLAFPAMWVLNGSTNFLLRLLGIPSGSEHDLAHSGAELKLIASASHEQGMFTLSRLLMMENVIDFGTLTVDDVMVPMSRVAVLDPAKSWKDNFDTIEHTLHSRYLLAPPSSGKVVHVKDMLLNSGRGGMPDLGAISRPALRVAPEVAVEELLRRFVPGGPHLALVEKNGAPLGIVTLEDIIEELVGPINDEFEKVKDYRLGEIVAPEAIVFDIAESPKQVIVQKLARGIAASRKDVDVEKAVAAVMKREALASTGLGMGVAIPHGRVEGLVRPAAALGRAVPGGLNFGSMDGKPVSLIFLILSPPHDEGAHLHILEKISSLLLSDYLRERLISAGTAEEVLGVFRDSDKSLPA